MALNEFMLKDADVLESIDLSVDYFGNDASVDEHGEILLEVNRAELCVQSSLPATEWWPTVHCMFGMQSCLTNGGAAGTSCQEAETGVDDDLKFAGGDRMAQLSGCECSLDGVADTCTSLHASKSWAELKASCDVDAEAKLSSARAVAADSGATMWVTVDGARVVYEEGGAYGGTNTAQGFGAWASRVMAVTCNAIVAKGQAAPESCAAYFP